MSIALPSQYRLHCSLRFLPQLEQLPRIDIASRLTLAATGYVQPQLISKQDIPVSLCCPPPLPPPPPITPLFTWRSERLTSQITIIDVLDTCAISAAARDEVIKCYPSARLAQLRVSPNVPFVKDRSAATFPRSPRPTTSTCFCRCSRSPLESRHLPRYPNGTAISHAILTPPSPTLTAPPSPTLS